jgi:hypothetical protein
MGKSPKELRERTLQWLREGKIPTPAAKPKTKTVVVSLEVCPLEGNVLEPCSGCKAGSRHVRECDHDDNPTGKCTRSFVSDRVWSCDRCTVRPTQVT